MRWSLKLGRIAGIEVYLHWTFFLLIGFVFFSDLWQGDELSTAARVPAAAQAVLFVLALFGCIVLHELGHSLAARKYGIPTRDITLLPIGGVARLERMPREPMQELWVAVAGPLVNLMIAGVLAVVLLLLRATHIEMVRAQMQFVFALLVMNLFLLVFNMLPAFPMDGGRVLRALLARRLEYVRATWIAARIGQVMALLFVVAGIIAPQPMLAIIGIVIFFGARNEAWIAEMTARHPEFDLERAL